MSFTKAESKAMAARLAGNYKVDPVSGCWLWTGEIVGRGYGAIYIERNGKQQRVYARVASYVSEFGNVPNGNRIRTKCGNKSCISPHHFTLQKIAMSNPSVTIESVYKTVCKLGHLARAVDVAKELGVDCRDQLEAIELLLEDPANYSPLVANGKKFYQAI